MNEVPKEFLEMVENDIARIDQAVKNGLPTECWNLFREIDGRYQSCIMNWYNSMWESSADGTRIFYGRLQERPNEVKENLKFAKAKLETYKYQMNAVAVPQLPQTNISVTNTNQVHIGITLEEARQRIDDMTALDNDQANELKNRINELEAISKEQSSRRAKWEKVKPIIAGVLKFGADAALVVLQAILQMKLAG
jgi:hypothetical protein